MKTKEALLLDWCASKKVFSKADVMSWGLENYYIRADRTIRDFVNEGRVNKLGEIEKMVLNLKGNMAYYQWRG